MTCADSFRPNLIRPALLARLWDFTGLLDFTELLHSGVSMDFDVAVIGCGGIGSAVVYHAARLGARTLGLEQFQFVHDRGSSHGQTRIIRQAYFEHPHYVPLLLEAYELWHQLEQERRQQLYFQTGLLQAGPHDGVIVPGVLASAHEHKLRVEPLTAAQAMARFPMFRLPSDHVAAYEPRAGYLLVEQCVEAHLKAAQGSGATLLSEVKVLDYTSHAGGVRLNTTHGSFTAKQVIMTVGAWLPDWLQADYAQLRVLRKHLHWFSSSDERTKLTSKCPLYFFENSSGCYYGFPSIDALGIKVAEHSGGEEVTDPAKLDRTLDAKDLSRIEAFLKQTFYGEMQHQQHVVCMYTMTDDHHFLIDRHPADERIWLAGGFSGHGFKFASVMGRLLAQACLGGSLDKRLEFLGLNRFTS
jgi:sarcosine oxidase